MYLQATAKELTDNVLRKASPNLIGPFLLFHLCCFILCLHSIVILITHNQLNAYLGRIRILLWQLFHLLLVLLLTGVVSNTDGLRRLSSRCLLFVLLWASIKIQPIKRLYSVSLHGACSIHASFWIVSACLLASSAELLDTHVTHVLIPSIRFVLLEQQLALRLIRVDGGHIDVAVGVICHLVHLNFRSLSSSYILHVLVVLLWD